MATHSIGFAQRRIEPLALQQRANGFNLKVTVKYSDINDSSLTTDGDLVAVKLFTTPAHWAIAKVMAVVRTAFTTDGTLTVKVGTASDDDMQIAAASVKTAGAISPAAGLVPTAASLGNTAADIIATFATQASTGAPADISAGEVDFYFEVIDADALD